MVGMGIIAGALALLLDTPLSQEFEDPLPAGAVARLGTSRLRPAFSVYGLALSPDGKKLASISSTGILQVWNASTGKVELTKSTGGYSGDPIFNADSSSVAAGGNGGLHWFSLAPGRQANPGDWNKGCVRRLSVSHDGSAIASVIEADGVQIVLVMNAKTGEEVMRCFGEPEYDCPFVLNNVGTQLFVGAGSGSIVVYSVISREKTQVIKAHESAIRSLACSPNGQLIASSSDDKTAGIWNSTDGTLLGRLSGHSKSITSMVFSRDGHFLATASDDMTARVWEVASRQERVRIPLGSPAGALVFSGDGKRVIIGQQSGGIRVLDASTGEEVLARPGHDGSVLALAYCPNASFLASAGNDRVIRLWDVGLRKEIVACSGHRGAITSLAFSPVGDRLASGAEDQTVRVWRLPGGQIDHEKKSNVPFNFIESLSFSADGKSLGVGGSREIGIWSPERGGSFEKLQEASRNFPLPSSSITFSSDGRWIAWGDSDGAFRLRDLKGLNRETVFNVDRERPTCLVFSCDSSLLASSSSDRLVRVWDPATGAEVSRSEPFSAQITSLSFSPSGGLLAVGQANGMVSILESWNLVELLTLRAASGRTNAVTFLSAQLLASGHENTTVLVWDTYGIESSARPDLKSLNGTLWQKLASKDLPTVLQAIQQLALARGDAVKILDEGLRPMSQGEILEHLRHLDADDPKARESALACLQLAAGETAEELKKVISHKDASPEAARRARLLLDGLGPKCISSQGRLRVLRSIQVLERIGTEDARKVLCEVTRRWGSSLESTFATAAEKRMSLERRR